jgi:hypothetical protein
MTLRWLSEGYCRGGHASVLISNHFHHWNWQVNNNFRCLKMNGPRRASGASCLAPCYLISPNVSKSQSRIILRWRGFFLHLDGTGLFSLLCNLVSNDHKIKYPGKSYLWKSKSRGDEIVEYAKGVLTPCMNVQFIIWEYVCQIFKYYWTLILKMHIAWLY